MSWTLSDGRSSRAYEEYGQALGNALNVPGWVHDPSYALGQDPGVYSKVMRDPVVASAMRYRMALAAGREWRVEPASDAPADKLAATVIEDLLRKIQGFGDARQRLALSIFRGSAYEAICGSWRRERIAGVDARWWVPAALRNVDRRRFRLWSSPGTEPEWRLLSVARQVWEPLSEEHARWFARVTFEETEDTLGYGSGLLDTIYRLQALKSQRMQNLGRAGERFSNGLAVARIESAGSPPTAGPSRAVKTRADAFASAYARHRTDDLIVFDKRDELSFVNGLGEGLQVLTHSVDYCDVSMVMAILGSSLATMQSMNEVGSNAKAQTHADTTESLVQSDRDRLGECLTRDVVGLTWAVNRAQIQAIAPGANMPALLIGQQHQDDPPTAAQVVSTLLGGGVRLRADEVYAKTGFTPPAAGDAVIEPPQPQAPGGPL